MMACAYTILCLRQEQWVFFVAPLVATRFVCVLDLNLKLPVRHGDVALIHFPRRKNDKTRFATMVLLCLENTLSSPCKYT